MSFARLDRVIIFKRRQAYRDDYPQHDFTQRNDNRRPSDLGDDPILSPASTQLLVSMAAVASIDRRGVG